MNRKILFPIVIFVIIIVGIFIVKGDEIKNYLLSITQPSVSSSPTPTESEKATPTPTGGSSVSNTVSPSSVIPPICWLTGQIIYDGEVFQHTGAQEFNYKDVDDPHDIIKWQISPSGEAFSIGPNRLSGLKLPKGSDYLTISFEGLTPKYKKYDLTASIDYVAVVDNAAKILNVKCSGKTTLMLNK